MRLRLTHIALSAELRAPGESLPDDLRRRIAALPHAVAESVDRHVQRQCLGYYPALSHFLAQTLIDPEAPQALAVIAEHARRYVQHTTLRRLSAPFVQVRCDHSLPMALTLPRVNPKDPNRLATLARHYQPDLIRIQLIACTPARAEEPCIAAYARERAVRWLNGCVCGRITQSYSL